MKSEYNKIRQTWDIDPATKQHGERKASKTFQRRKNRQSLNSLVGNFSRDELDEIEIDD